jgi:hypothetical protein
LRFKDLTNLINEHARDKFAGLIPVIQQLSRRGFFVECRLSIRHALALLPALLAKGIDERSRGDYPNRFSID